MKEKKKYVKPRIDILNCQCGESVMITVSGSTTPEESQAKGNLWDDDGRGNSGSNWKRNLWDD